MGVGAREAARLLKMGPNTEREYREALALAGLLDGEVDDLPALDVLKQVVARQLATAPPPQMVSSIDRWEARIVALAEAGLTPRPIHDGFGSRRMTSGAATTPSARSAEGGAARAASVPTT